MRLALSSEGEGTSTLGERLSAGRQSFLVHPLSDGAGRRYGGGIGARLLERASRDAAPSEDAHTPSGLQPGARRGGQGEAQR